MISRRCRAVGLALVILLLAASLSGASQSACPEQYAAGHPPEIVRELAAAPIRELCSSGFVVLYSGVTRTPLYGGEHLTRERVMQARGVERKGRFHADSRQSDDERAEVRDYAGSGYDRGHMASIGDMPDLRSHHESFVLSNIVPQEASVNMGIWSRVEALVRQMVLERGELFVVTGPLFTVDAGSMVGGRVLVPAALFKGVYEPDRNEAAAYLVDNVPGVKPRVVSIEEVNRFAGFDLFPEINARAKVRAALLQLPQWYKGKTADDGGIFFCDKESGW